MKLDKIIPFTPGVKKFVLCLFSLQAVAVALMVNVFVAFALVVAMGAAVTKLYQINPEPIFLLFMHVVISGSILYDPTTTFALISVVVSVAAAVGDLELPKERAAVFVLSVTTTAFFGTITAAVTSVAIGFLIIIFKLHPVQPPTLTLLALGCLALTLLANTIAGSIAVVFLMVVVTVLFILNRLHKKWDTPDTISISTVKQHSYPNGYLALSNITESLDLQGYNVTGSVKALHEFLREHEDEYRKNRTQHIRHVTIITGEGNYSDPQDSTNLIKPTVINFLKINKYKYEVSSESPGLIRVDLESHFL